MNNKHTRIIKPGKPGTIWFGMKCPYCDCEFQFNKDAVVYGMPENAEFSVCLVNCPNCELRLKYSQNDCISYLDIQKYHVEEKIEKE